MAETLMQSNPTQGAVDTLNAKLLINRSSTGITTFNDSQMIGVYFVYDNSVSNLPTSNTSTYYKVIAIQSIQIAAKYNSPYDMYIRMYVNSTWTAWKPFYSGFCTIESVENRTFANGTESEWFGNYVYSFSFTKTGYRIIAATCSTSGASRATFVRNYWDSGVAVIALNGKADLSGSVAFRLTWAKV